MRLECEGGISKCTHVLKAYALVDDKSDRIKSQSVPFLQDKQPK